MPTVPTISKVIRLQNSPLKEPVLALGAVESTFKLSEEPIPELKDGEVLVQIVYLSNDPAQRSYIQKNADEKRMYHPPVKEGDVMAAWGIGRVIASKSNTVKEGTLVNGAPGWKEYAVLSDKVVRPLNVIPGYSPSIFVGALGGPGLTAYFGLTDVLKLQKGQSIVVSGAAGAVGNIVVQYAKHVIGASKVIAIAGSQDKCDWLKGLGADVALNYKEASFHQDLDAATEGYVDAFFDNVGGEILDHMLARVKRFGRIAACGAISIYNDRSSTKLSNYAEIITNRLTVQGFIIIDYFGRMKEGIDALGGALQSGKLKIEGGETICEIGFEDIPKTWGKLFVGGNTGKLVSQIANV